MTDTKPGFKKVAISVVATFLIVLAILGVLDQKGEIYTGEAFKRALITFGVARGLNGVISVAQGTEIALHPAGFGLNFAPGQILDPINDLVEQFSWVMLASSASLGIQKVLLSISATFLVTFLVVVILTLYLLSMWRPALFSPDIKKLITSGAIIVLFIRFSIPLAAFANEGLYRYFLHDQYVESSNRLEDTQKNISELSNEDQVNYQSSDAESLLDMAKRLYESASQKITVNTRIEKYQEVAAEATEHAINLIVVFVIQTIMFPLLFLWIFYRALKVAWAKLIPV